MLSRFIHYACIISSFFVALSFGTGCRCFTSTSGRKALPEAAAYTLVKRNDYWETVVDGHVPALYQAVLAGLTDLEVVPLTKHVDKVVAQVEAIFADQVLLEIGLENIGSGKSIFRMRTGHFDDEDRMILVFKAIAPYLANAADISEPIPISFMGE